MKEDHSSDPGGVAGVLGSSPSPLATTESERLADAFRDGFLTGVVHTPWEDMHDWLALVSHDYAKNPDETMSKANKQGRRETEDSGAVLETMTEIAFALAECEDDFHVCSRCGHQDNDATRDSNLYLMVKARLAVLWAVIKGGEAENPTP